MYRNTVPGPLEQFEGVAGACLARLLDTQVKAEPPAGKEALRESVVVHADTEFVAGQPRLRDHGNR